MYVAHSRAMLVNVGVACHAVDVLAIVAQPPRRVAPALHADHNQWRPAAPRPTEERKRNEEVLAY